MEKRFILKEEKNLKPIVFIDTEIEPKSGKILDIGGVKGVGSSFHSNSYRWREVHGGTSA
ncbi:hypothetical protein [Desulfosporosinus sp. BICA1-9]|uniref:hypothetical protein n=1 Tax=Desulfosporosinus sp. BICA1-9 TaxID=1531958 RepID=UPI00054C6505|nr:hypothetical protein [Desulfosporosinus sp. BICA1-9]KJS46136.1 MAG: hypothetical protein VR66_26985 [Peptococcaceae bacterium BRH_c23]KJS85524.1 MAG: hypothetical protein JL57_18620 [Desulfosporosinus sp. BICA1-9]HBW36886.1 hypothetical protein [Desulfosporosinus sp.]